MIKNITIPAIFTLVLAIATGPSFGAGAKAVVIKRNPDDTIELEVGQFLRKTPEEVLSAFKITCTADEVENAGIFGAWTKEGFSKKEELRVFTLWMNDKNLFIKGRPLILFKAKFSKPKFRVGYHTKDSRYKCWDAFYLLGARPDRASECLCPAPLGHKCPVHK